MDRRSLLRQALGGFGQLVLIMALCLFLPAGTLRFWQAWVLLGVFSACTLAITLRLLNHDPKLLERRLHGGPSAEKEPRQKVIQALAGVAFLAALVVPALDHRFAWSPLPPWAALVGDGLVVLAFWIIYRVFEANSFTSSTIEVGADQRVVSTGPYARVRHPMYAGGLLLFLALPLALGSGLGTLVFIPALIVIVWRLLEEETFLRRQLPGYAAYCEQTRYRLLPHVW